MALFHASVVAKRYGISDEKVRTLNLGIAPEDMLEAQMGDPAAFL